jgi:uncharacterized protein (TIGR01777 family)
MRAVISGGTGLIGTALGERLLADGWEVVALSRSPVKARGLPEGMQVAGWDPYAVGAWAGVLEGADAVLHLAGENLAAGRWTAARKRRLMASRVETGRVLAEVIGGLEEPPGVFVQASGVNYYGPRGDEVVTEDTGSGKDFLARLCVEWEGATAPVETRGVRRPVLRTGMVLSRRGGALGKMLPAFRMSLGGPLGHGLQWVSWIHLADAVEAIRFLIGEEGATGSFNLTAPQPVRNEDLTAELAAALGRPAWLRAPAWALRLALGELAQVLLTGQRALPSRLQEAGFGFRFPELSAALEDLL